MTIERARKLLRKEGNSYSDEQILAIINNARVLSQACVHKIDKKINTDGVPFFTNKAYLEVI